jgi:hypothetical protein
VEALAKETPPVDNAASRFGNPAFRTFYDKVQQARDKFYFLLMMKAGWLSVDDIFVFVLVCLVARLLRNYTSCSSFDL